MAEYELRQTALIQGSGPGAMTVLTEGLSVIIPGIDAWYLKGGNQQIPDECRISDINLAKHLGVDIFVQPPVRGVSNPKNNGHAEILNASIYPRWVICYSCRRLSKLGKSDQILDICHPCKDAKKKFKSKRVQVNFVIACESGHLDEFPWNEWVHKSLSPKCDGTNLKIIARGSGDLNSQLVKCEAPNCKMQRSLAGTSDNTKVAGGGTTLSGTLSSDGAKFVCSGSRPWLGEFSENCDKDVRMVIRNASNIYYSMTSTSILAPETVAVDETLLLLLTENARYKVDFQIRGFNVDAMLTHLRNEYKNMKPVFAEFNDETLKDAITKVFLDPHAGAAKEDSSENDAMRKPEWKAFGTLPNTPDLVVRDVGYASDSIWGVSQVLAVPRLKKTTALFGFTRLLPDPIKTSEGKRLLRRNPNPHDDWLPAVQHSGEGIFISLNETAVANWEANPAAVSRIGMIHDNLLREGREKLGDPTTPRKVLLHTLSHVLIQQLVLDCGYMAASLSERIYAWNGVAGILIYTAGADSDGTMGGLVEMSKPEILKDVFERAISGAQWCSNDPVCMELGKMAQGALGSNLAACHNCCLIPETACEYFNQELDRALLVGDLHNPTGFKGFFSSLE
jgi:hypothetical protein